MENQNIKNQNSSSSLQVWNLSDVIANLTVPGLMVKTSPLTMASRNQIHYQLRNHLVN